MTSPRIALALFAFASQGCLIGYSHSEPNAPVSSAMELSSFYVMKGGFIVGGQDGVVEAIRELHPNIERRDDFDPPKTGTFLRVRARDVELSTGAKVWGYASLSLFTLIPFYSGDGGVDLVYEVFRDGEKTMDRRYEIRRWIFMWAPVLPFVWLNAATDSEHGAAYDTTMRFFEEVGQRRPEARLRGFEISTR